MRWGLYLVVALGVFVGLSLVSFWLAVRPPRLTIPLAPADVELAVEDVAVPTADGLQLRGWLAVRPGAPALVLLHGYPAEKADMLPLAAALAPRFTVLLMDLRYFGGSGGRATTFGLRERDDLRRAIDVLARRGADRVGVFGFSLGGAIALVTAAEDPRIGAVAAYAPFADLRMLAHGLYAWMGPLRYPFVGLMRLWSRVFLGADVTTYSPLAAAARLSIPVWLIASRDDEQIPFAHAERLRAALAANPRAEDTFLDAARHGVLPPDVERRLERFFLRALSPSSNATDVDERRGARGARG
jgi:dipeptidyl aminopeptidase/acylaminoacyl peptidase